MKYHREFTRLGMRDIRQINLLKIWERSASNSLLPSFDVFDFEQTSRTRDSIAICDVKRDGSSLEFQIAYHGADFRKIYGEGRVGERLGVSVSSANRDSVLAIYRDVVETCSPSFSNWPITNGDGSIIQYERLLLPFTVRGVGVDRILCSLSLFSAETPRSPSDIVSGQLSKRN